VGHLSLIIAWRLTHERYQDQAMTGNGGLFAPGRWHSQGRRVIYSSSSLALATLELFVNLQDKEQLAHYVKTRIGIPEDLVEALEEAALHAFLKDPDQFDSRGYGDRWLAEARSCVLKVPSRVVPQEWNYLLNPLHPAFQRITAETDAYQVDERLWR
jgi:RES domain-containing protein